MMTSGPSSAPCTKTSRTRPSRASTGLAMLGEVLDVQRTQRVFDFGPVERTQVVDAADQRPDVGLRLVELACRGFGGGQRLQELPEEAHVGVVTSAGHSAVVKLIGGELFELFASRHDRSHTGNASAEPASVADRRCAPLPRLCLQLAGMSRSTWGPPTRSSTSADAESCCP